MVKLNAGVEGIREEVDGKMTFVGITLPSGLSEFVEQECRGIDNWKSQSKHKNNEALIEDEDIFFILFSIRSIFVSF